MSIKKLNNDNRSMATVYESYDSGEIDGTTTEVEVTPSETVAQLMINPLVASTVKLNDSEKEIYLPAGVWTPISVLTDSFTIKTVSESGKIYWQGWIL
jgi:hypothetical protein